MSYAAPSDSLTPEQVTAAREYQRVFDLNYVEAMIDQRLNSQHEQRRECVIDVVRKFVVVDPTYRVRIT